MTTQFKTIPNIDFVRASLGYTTASGSRPIFTNGEFFEDFCSFGGCSATVGGAQWILAGTNSAVTGVTTHTTNADGWATITTAGSSGDEEFLQLFSAPCYFSFSTTAPRATVFQCKVKISTITTANVLVGLFAPTATTGTTDPEDTQAVGFGFICAAGTLNYISKTSAATVTSTSMGMSVTAADVLTLSVFHDGATRLIFVAYNNTTGVTATVSTTLASFTAASLGPCMGISTASGATKAFDIDYIYCATEGSKTGH